MVNLLAVSDLFDWLSEPIVIIFLWLTITSVVGSIAHYWHKVRRDELELALKQEMVQRGMSADEIVKVLQGSKGRAPKKASASQPSPQETVNYEA